MYKVGVASPKGGVGKTTISWNLCGHWHREGLKVCLVDLDEQQNATDMAKKGNVLFPVLAAIPKDGFDVCVIDHAPSTKTKNYGDVIIRPLKAAALDKASFERSKPMFQGKKIIYVVSVLRLQSKTQMDIALQMRQDEKAFWVRERTIYERAMAEGCTIAEITKSSARYDAMNEIALIAQKVELCLTS